MKEIRVTPLVTKRAIPIAACVLCCLVLLTGCGGGSQTQKPHAATPEPTNTPAGPAQTARTVPQALLSINEIGLGPKGYVTLLNFTKQRQQLQQLRICQESKCVDLPDVSVKPGGRARVATGPTKDLGAVVMADAALGDLKASNGEIAIFATNDAGSRRLVTFMEWGSSPHMHTRQAIADGLWIKGSYAPTAPTAVRLYQKRGGLWVFDTH
jgi:hypothetical protein